MKKLVSGLMAAAVAVSFTGAGLLSASAAPVYVPHQAPTVNSAVHDVQFRKWNRHGNFHNGGRGISRHNDGGRAFWNGHRGSREWHRGYRRHGDYWFPLAAFATGALITGAIANQSGYGSSHEQRCYEHYRSYRASDNTFQPYNGPRQQCRL